MGIDMKRRLLLFQHHLPWLCVFLGMDGFAVLLLWLADADAFYALTAVVFLATVLLFAAVLFVLSHLEQKKMQAFEEFLNNPDDCHEEKLLKEVSLAEAEAVRLVGAILREKQFACSRAEAGLAEYEEYVEVWAHETKTPLSLLTMILDNRSDEISAPICFKLDYIRNQMQENISQMLYYARLKGGGRKDYRFEYIDARMCVDEVLEDYKPLLEEKRFQVCNQLPHAKVYTDRRGIQFLLGQIVSNAVKYSAENPELSITLKQAEGVDILRIRDNGTGVRSCDFPFIFEKGFTGNSVDSGKKATGMGLYLSKRIADDLNISLEAQSGWGKGFEMAILFPQVDD